MPGSPFRYFLEEARVALNDGAEYGRGGEGFVRLNFGCARATLAEALGRIEDALLRRRGRRQADEGAQSLKSPRTCPSLQFMAVSCMFACKENDGKRACPTNLPINRSSHFRRRRSGPFR